MACEFANRYAVFCGSRCVRFFVISSYYWVKLFYSFEEQQIAQPSGSHISKRQIAYISPRLGVLNNIPFAIPFDVRVSIFRHFVANDMVSHRVNRYGSGRTRVSVRRGSVAQDGFDRLEDADLKAPIEITFIDQFGQEE